MKLFRIILVMSLLLITALPCLALQFEQMVDMPTAGTLNRAQYAVNLRMQPVGGLLFGLSFGLFDRLNLGFSYGGDNVIGYGNINWNPQPGFQIKYRIFDESYAMPAIAVGFDNQGFGYWTGSRYFIKSRGFYAAASKNYKFLGTLAFHGGASYSLEERHSPDTGVDFYAGIEKSLNPELWMIAEYDMALNDNEKDGQYGEGYGYLNVGLRWLFGSHLMLEADLKNLMRNGQDPQTSAMIGRTVKLAYYDSF
jgi:hypothetical protein